MNTLSITTVQRHLTTGDAVPLLPDGIPGPVHYAEAWWAVPNGGVDYQKVTDQQQLAQFTALAQRLATGAQALQQEQRMQGGDVG